MKKSPGVAAAVVLSSTILALTGLTAIARELPPGPRATLVVTKSADTDDGACDGDCSLREAIAAANPGDTITFDASLSGATIPLSSSLDLSKNVTIDGSSLEQQVTLSGQNAVRVFRVFEGVTASLYNLSIAYGKAYEGAGIQNIGTLTVTNCNIFFNKTVVGFGGGIVNRGTLTVANCALWDNEDSGIYNSGLSGQATVVNSTFNHNISVNWGGGGIVNEALLTLVNCTLANNFGYYRGGGVLNNNNGTMNYSNTIIANNTCHAECYDCYNTGTIGTNVNNLVKDGTCGAAFTGDPQIEWFGYYLGPTKTCSLYPGSPAIDAGSDSVCESAPISGKDQRGAPRPSGPHCDIGAYEYHPREITAFSFDSVPAAGSIAGTNISVTVPFGTDVTALAPTVTHNGASVSPASGAARDFTSPVIYTVTAGDGLPREYTVTVTVACGAPAVVTNANDSGLGSLRHAIGGVCPGGTVTFSGDFTITLASELVIGKDMTIDGAGYFVTVSGNNAARVFSVDAGVTAALNNLTIADGNAGGGNGGGILNPAGAALNVTNSTFTGCFSYLGGGIYNEGALTVANSTFSGNTTTDGGGICNSAPGSLSVTNSTFSGNNAYWEGGSIFNTGAFTYANCILADSTVDSGGVECWTSVVPAGANNLVEDGSCYAAIMADPNLGPLADNGGVTRTHALLPGSTAIDAGGDAACGASPVSGKDQRGMTRPQGAHCDIGAFESNIQSGSSLVVNATGDTDDGSCDLLVGGITDCTLREALRAARAHPGPDTIGFDAALSGQTILLGSALPVDSDVSIDGSGIPITVSGNNAVRVFSVDAGVTAALNNLTIADGNAGGGNGGGILNPAGAALTVTNSTFTGCFSYLGGGIYNEGALTVANSTFSGNTTTDGGGICNNAPGTLNVTNSTFSGNRAYWEGGSIFNTGTFTYANCILADSTVDSGGVECWSSAVPASSNNLTEDGTCLAAIVADPLLGPLAGNGGHTRTHALLPGSPAIDAGGDAACAASPVSGKDQRGMTRPQGAHCDMGSHEYYPKEITAFDFAVPPVTGVITGTSIDLTVPYGTDVTTLVPTVTHTGAALSPPSGAARNFTNPVMYTVTAGDGLTKAYTVTVTVQCSTGFIVTSNSDSGAYSLRDAIAHTCSGGTITFHPSLSGATIALSSPLVVAEDLTIDGSALAAQVTLSGQNSTRVLTVNGVVAALKNVTISGGFCGNDAGGGVYNDHGALSLTDCTVSQNSSIDNGGGFYNYMGSITLTGCTLSDNHAGSIGGGVCNYNGTLTIANSTLSGNSAGYKGGCIGGGFGFNTITNSTISGNTAAAGAGGISSAMATLYLANTIVANNLGGDCHNENGIVGANINSLIETNGTPPFDCGTPAYSGDPLLGPLENNGGPTLTMAPGTGSEVIDHGDDTICASAPVNGHDQRGAARPFGPRCDIGAYEFWGAMPSAPVADGRLAGAAARFTNNGSGSERIDVTYDAAHCPAEKAVILYGAIGSFQAGYQGCADEDAGSAGAASFDSSGMSDVWFNIIWTSGKTAGHPGYGFDGTDQVARTWTAGALCGMTGDDHGRAICP